jgi:hypothetical protein
MIWALRNLRLVLAGVLVLAVPLAFWAIWHAGGDEREAALRARAAEERLRVITEERTQDNEIDALPDADLRRRLDQWMRQ